MHEARIWSCRTCATTRTTALVRAHEVRITRDLSRDEVGLLLDRLARVAP